MSSTRRRCSRTRSRFLRSRRFLAAFPLWILPGGATATDRDRGPALGAEEIRRSIEKQIREELARKGVRRPVVRVLSAYKQGYSWLDEVVRPALEGRSVDELVIRFAAISSRGVAPSGDGNGSPMASRGVPIDEILARDLGSHGNECASRWLL
jgi:hypothetical protein